MNALVHSENSVKRWGGKIKDYLEIHKKMDCSKAYISDNRHRALTHTLFWVNEVMIPIFGDYIILKNKKKISVKDICEQHILEDYRLKFIPTPQDFIQEMEMKEWMENGKGICPSAIKLYPELKTIEDLKKEKELKKEIEKQKEEIVKTGLDFTFMPGMDNKILDGKRGRQGGSKVID